MFSIYFLNITIFLNQTIPLGSGDSCSHCHPPIYATGLFVQVPHPPDIANSRPHIESPSDFLVLRYLWVPHPPDLAISRPWVMEWPTSYILASSSPSRLSHFKTLSDGVAHIVSPSEFLVLRALWVPQVLPLGISVAVCCHTVEEIYYIIYISRIYFKKYIAFRIIIDLHTEKSFRHLLHPNQIWIVITLLW